jgi:hypothetical protein
MGQLVPHYAAVVHGADQWYEMVQRTAFAAAVGAMAEDH